MQGDVTSLIHRRLHTVNAYLGTRTAQTFFHSTYLGPAYYPLVRSRRRPGLLCRKQACRYVRYQQWSDWLTSSLSTCLGVASVDLDR